MTLLVDETAAIRRPIGVVRVTGPERLTYLHQLLSQSVDDAEPGTVRDFLYLDPKGNPHAAGRLVVHAEAVLLAVAPEVAAELAALLDKFRFLTQVEVVDDGDAWVLASIRGPRPPNVPGVRPEPLTATPNRLAPDAAPGDGGLVIRDRTSGIDLLGAGAWVDDRLADLALPEAGEADWEAWRITAGEPGWRSEIAAGRRPQELGLLPTHVHLRKGCYPGQESIAKTYNLGQPRRALCIVDFDGPVAAGERLAAGDKAGEITSAAPLGAGWVALALLPLDRDTGEPPALVTAEGGTGRVRQRVGAGLPQPGA
jgi:tRNA-modifying protein YgfZ